MKRKIEMTEEEIQKALVVFRIAGGLIKQLPELESPKLLLVGSELGMYENPTDQWTSIYGE